MSQLTVYTITLLQAQQTRALAALQSQLEASQGSPQAVKTANQAAMTDAAACAESRLQQLSTKHAKVCYPFTLRLMD